MPLFDAIDVAGGAGGSGTGGIARLLWQRGMITDEQWAEIQKQRGQSTFDTLPKFDLPPAPGFGGGFDSTNPPFGAFTEFGPTGGVDESIMNLIRQSAERKTISGFIPDQADFDANLAAQMDEIFARAGVSREQLAADISARGIGGAGEIPRTLVRDIQGPAVRAAATVSAQAQLAFGQQVQKDAIAQEAALATSRGQLLDIGKTNAALASAEAQLGASLESQERMAANRNALQLAIHNDNISLEQYRVMVNAQLQEYLSHMNFLTATEVARIRGEFQVRAAKAATKKDIWDIMKSIPGLKF